MKKTYFLIKLFSFKYINIQKSNECYKYKKKKENKNSLFYHENIEYRNEHPNYCFCIFLTTQQL